MSGKFRLSIFIALCILVSCAFAARTTSQSTYPRVHRKRVVGATNRMGESQKTAASSSSSSSATTTSTSSKSQTGNLLKVAKALARSHSTSEVLTLNLTNLLILIVLKAVIFGIGLFYFGGVTFKGHGGHGGGHGGGWSSRSLDGKSSSFMTEGELMLMLTYLLGATNDNYECMYRVACEDPSKAKEYLNVSKMIVKGAKFMKKYVSYNSKYEDIIFGLQGAVDHKLKGGDCSARYVCSDVPNL